MASIDSRTAVAIGVTFIIRESNAITERLEITGLQTVTIG